MKPRHSALHARAAAVAWMVVALQGCAQQTQDPPARAADEPSKAVEQVARDSANPAAFIDRQAEINPTPEQRTRRDFAILHAEIARVRALRGRLPRALEEILTRPEPDPNLRPQRRWLLDGWNRPIRYTPREPYELRSAGEDGVWGTADDLVSPAPG